VNFSAAQFKNFDLLGDIKKALTRAQLAPKRLQIEITESFLMADEAHTLHILTELKKIGVCIAMDDFGTGYSSLSYLNRFPIDKLKIDRSFIKELPSESNALAILRSVTGLGSSLGMVTTAEGVETKEQLAIVEMEGCSEVQGYFFSAPRAAHEVPDLIEECSKKYAMLARSRQAD
jgi:EAL domain-containing protein (putative c-di-GMP-specific phosphodiesterase class I)